VNPIAGMGGRVGLKGTDGSEILELARRLSAVPQALDRAREALVPLSHLKEEIDFITCPGLMGETVARDCGFAPKLTEGTLLSITTAEDTIRAAGEMRAMAVDLLLFVGGDGTARDIYRAVGHQLVVLGIPAGVKIHSAVYATNPLRAGELAALYLQGKIRENIEAEVMDINEEDYRRGILSASLHGYLTIPFEKRYVQTLKTGSPVTDRYAQEAIAADVVENMSDEFYYIIGPGSTTRVVMEALRLNNTLLGIDLVFKRKLIGKDLSETALLEKLQREKAKLVITPIGGQGYILGRGNQQISPSVIKTVGKENILIIATRQKINSFFGRPLLVDTGDRHLDQWLSDYYKIVTGYHEAVVYRVAN
jgi:predicted polyphosphate/ATP-dependent NAD kinase